MTARVLTITIVLMLASCASRYQPAGCEYCSAGLQQLRIGQ